MELDMVMLNGISMAHQWWFPMDIICIACIADYSSVYPEISTTINIYLYIHILKFHGTKWNPSNSHGYRSMLCEWKTHMPSGWNCPNLYIYIYIYIHISTVCIYVDITTVCIYIYIQYTYLGIHIMYIYIYIHIAYLCIYIYTY